MMKNDVIVALDFKDAKTTCTFLDLFKDEKPFVKIGMELFYAEGPAIVKEVKARGHKLFLDLKLHDIPNTVERGMASIARLGADMTNLHAAGGTAMMAAALKGLAENSEAGKAPLLLAVTQLTSTSEEVMQKELLIPTTIEDAICHYAKNAKTAGLAGVVCSPLEAGFVKTACGTEFLTVTPGIRYPENGTQDQSRITTPQKARELGTNFIVVGRPITAAKDPLAAYRQVAADFLG